MRRLFVALALLAARAIRREHDDAPSPWWVHGHAWTNARVAVILS